MSTASKTRRSWLARLTNSLLGPPKSDVLEPTPIVTPDPQAAEALERRMAQLAYCPENGFNRDQRQQRSNVIPMRRRAR